MLVAGGSPDGQVKGRARLNVLAVTSGRLTICGNGTSVPPLNGTGVLLRLTNSVHGDEGEAKVRSSSAGVPAICVPTPARNGVPKTPVFPKPRLVHVPRFTAVIVIGTVSEAMPLATTASA